MANKVIECLVEVKHGSESGLASGERPARNGVHTNEEWQMHRITGKTVKSIGWSNEHTTLNDGALKRGP